MSKSFADLKKSRTSALEKLTEELSKANTSPNKTVREDDTRFWNPSADKMGNGEAVVRFLPAPAGEEVPFVRVYKHAFQGPTGSWFIEECPTTIGKPCPVCDHNKGLWNSGDDADKKLASVQKRKMSFITNVYVVQDKANPENEGIVRLYKFGKKIFEKLNTAMNPEYEDEEPMNPFDLWEGANFRIKMKNVDGFRNYDASKFNAPTQLLKDEKEMEKIWEQTHSLQKFVDPSVFKSADEIKAKFNRVNGLDLPEARNLREELAEATAPKGKTRKPAAAPAVVEEDDEDLARLQAIAEGDDE